MYSLDVLLNIAFFHDEKQLFLFTIPVLPTASAVQPHWLQLDPRAVAQAGICSWDVPLCSWSRQGLQAHFCS